MIFYISHDNYGKLALISDKVGNRNRILIYDQLGVSVYHPTRFKLSDYAPAVPVTQDEFWENLGSIDSAYAENKHRDILAVPLKEFDPKSRWEFIKAKRFDDRLLVITRFRKFESCDWAITRISDNGGWSWHRLEYEPDFKEGGEDVSEDYAHFHINNLIRDKIEKNHSQIRDFINGTWEE